ncbi:hypothetical protein BC830DRAFT_1063018 [Chytriomyces sp. MP71]|nr:hypothetical protein BC830DRAFT_1063018 [Chytriomyces sp. MP71]
MVLRIAVIGSGPAAQYTVQHIAKRCGERSLAVDIFEQHPFPYGLVRYGIAADHQDAKHVANRFDTFLSSSSSSSPNFRVNWVGGVKVGDRITVKHLRQHYNAVLFANGAQEPKSLFPSNDKTIRASYSAHHLVSWLNGLPEAFQHAVPLAEDLQSTDTAVIVGQGNVALDVARILLTNVDALMKTDIPEPVLDVLAKSRISRVHLVARRGPLQMAFTSKELREMTRLPSASLLPNPLLSTDPYRTADSNPAFDRSPKRLMQILLNHHAQPTSSSAHKTWSLDWFLSPHRLLSSPADPTKLTGIQFQQTRSIPTAATPGASVESVPGAFVDVSCGIIFSSLGYKGVAVPSAAEAGIPFDAAM